MLLILAKLRQPTGQRRSNVRTLQTKISIGPILFLYYEESLVSSNFNSTLLKFHCAHPNVNPNNILMSFSLNKKLNFQFVFSVC